MHVFSGVMYAGPNINYNAASSLPGMILLSDVTHYYQSVCSGTSELYNLYSYIPNYTRVRSQHLFTRTSLCIQWNDKYMHEEAQTTMLFLHLNSHYIGV